MTINQNEIKVLMACIEAIKIETGIEFARTSKVDVPTMERNQINGYLSQEKELIKCWEANGNSNLSMTKLGCDVLLSQNIEGDVHAILDIREQI